MRPSLEPAGLAAALRRATAAVHREAERSGIVRDILEGRIDRRSYALYLRNLLPAYRALERGLEGHRGTPGVRELVLPQLYRAGPIADDLAVLAGPGWEGDLPLLTAGVAYGQRVQAAAGGDGARLVAHAYTRYLGDLSGGRILGRLVGRNPGMAGVELAFHDFPDIPDPEAFKAAYRAALDRAGRAMADPGAVVDEALVAFRLNIDVSEAVRSATARSP